MLDTPLQSLISHLDIYQEIPPEAYQVVAELLAFVYKIHNQWKAGTPQRQESGIPFEIQGDVQGSFGQYSEYISPQPHTD